MPDRRPPGGTGVPEPPPTARTPVPPPPTPETLPQGPLAPRVTTGWHADGSLAEAVHDAAMRFDRAWKDVVLPDLASFLPAAGTARVAVALELALVDLERRRTAGIAARADQYLAAFPELRADPSAVAELRRAEARPIDGAAGRYVVVRSHAEGGMGRVSVATDTELGREVAFKEIKVEYAHDPGARRRFVLEAEVTGRLEHPGIVPVYGLGVAPDGRPYYAMRFVAGQSLLGAIKTFHESHSAPAGGRAVAFRALLKRFVDVCNAVAFAHSKGVVHRDLKPANVMLGPFGETLVVDWGLAKEVSAFRRPGARLAGAEEELTQMGRAIGTPAYMAPEQARGEHDLTAPAADVYSLGATLYEILVGKAPFGGKSLKDVLADVTAGAFARPAIANPRVPRPLDAVCRKAMALDPAGRYATALELAADVERWLADEPVSAYRESFRERARRWRRRNSLLVNSFLALVLISTLTSGTAFGVVSEARRLELRAQKSEAQALRGQREALQTALVAESRALAQMREALDLTTDEVVVPLLGQQPELTAREKVYLKKLVDVYDRFAAERSDDPERRVLAARARLRVARIRYQLGEVDAAAADYFASAAAYSEVPDIDRRKADARDFTTALIGYARTIC